MKLRWTPHARADLRAIRAYVAEDSLVNADRLLDRLIRRAEQMTDFPRAGRVVPEFSLEDVRVTVDSGVRGIEEGGVSGWNGSATNQPARGDTPPWLTIRQTSRTDQRTR